MNNLELNGYEFDYNNNDIERLLCSENWAEVLDDKPKSKEAELTTSSSAKALQTEIGTIADIQSNSINNNNNLIFFEESYKSITNSSETAASLSLSSNKADSSFSSSTITPIVPKLNTSTLTTKRLQTNQNNSVRLPITNSCDTNKSQLPPLVVLLSNKSSSQTNQKKSDSLQPCNDSSTSFKSFKSLPIQQTITKTAMTNSKHSSSSNQSTINCSDTSNTNMINKCHLKKINTNDSTNNKKLSTAVGQQVHQSSSDCKSENSNFTKLTIQSSILKSGSLPKEAICTSTILTNKLPANIEISIPNSNNIKKFKSIFANDDCTALTNFKVFDLSQGSQNIVKLSTLPNQTKSCDTINSSSISANINKPLVRCQQSSVDLKRVTNQPLNDSAAYNNQDLKNKATTTTTSVVAVATSSSATPATAATALASIDDEATSAKTSKLTNARASTGKATVSPVRANEHAPTVSNTASSLIDHCEIIDCINPEQIFPHRQQSILQVIKSELVEQLSDSNRLEHVIKTNSGTNGHHQYHGYEYQQQQQQQPHQQHLQLQYNQYSQHHLNQVNVKVEDDEEEEIDVVSINNSTNFTGFTFASQHLQQPLNVPPANNSSASEYHYQATNGKKHLTYHNYFNQQQHQLVSNSDTSATEKKLISLKSEKQSSDRYSHASKLTGASTTTLLTKCAKASNCVRKTSANQTVSSSLSATTTTTTMSSNLNSAQYSANPQISTVIGNKTVLKAPPSMSQSVVLPTTTTISKTNTTIMNNLNSNINNVETSSKEKFIKTTKLNNSNFNYNSNNNILNLKQIDSKQNLKSFLGTPKEIKTGLFVYSTLKEQHLLISDINNGSNSLDEGKQSIKKTLVSNSRGFNKKASLNSNKQQLSNTINNEKNLQIKATSNFTTTHLISNKDSAKSFNQPNEMNLLNDYSVNSIQKKACKIPLTPSSFQPVITSLDKESKYNSSTSTIFLNNVNNDKVDSKNFKNELNPPKNNAKYNKTCIDKYKNKPSISSSNFGLDSVESTPKLITKPTKIRSNFKNKTQSDSPLLIDSANSDQKNLINKYEEHDMFRVNKTNDLKQRALVKEQEVTIKKNLSNENSNLNCRANYKCKNRDSNGEDEEENNESEDMDDDLECGVINKENLSANERLYEHENKSQTHKENLNNEKVNYNGFHYNINKNKNEDEDDDDGDEDDDEDDDEDYEDDDDYEGVDSNTDEEEICESSLYNDLIDTGLSASTLESANSINNSSLNFSTVIENKQHEKEKTDKASSIKRKYLKKTSKIKKPLSCNDIAYANEVDGVNHKMRKCQSDKAALTSACYDSYYSSPNGKSNSKLITSQGMSSPSGSSVYSTKSASSKRAARQQNAVAYSNDNPAEKRAFHILSERQRRNDLKKLFETLRSNIPNLCDKQKASKLTILKAAVEHLTEASSKKEKLSAIVEKEKSKQMQLIQQLKSLQQEQICSNMSSSTNEQFNIEYHAPHSFNKCSPKLEALVVH
jgi:hypothetical protein